MWTSFALEIILSAKRYSRSIDSVYSFEFFLRRRSAREIISLKSEVREVDDLFPILEEDMGVSKRKNWKETLSNANLCFRFDGC
jgi:hypothetical protein